MSRFGGGGRSLFDGGDEASRFESRDLLSDGLEDEPDQELVSSADSDLSLDTDTRSIGVINERSIGVIDGEEVSIGVIDGEEVSIGVIDGEEVSIGVIDGEEVSIGVIDGDEVSIGVINEDTVGELDGLDQDDLTLDDDLEVAEIDEGGFEGFDF